MRIEGPKPPSSFEEGKPPSGTSLSAIQYSVLTSVVSLQKEIISQGAPPHEAQPSGPVSTAPPTATSSVTLTAKGMTPAELGLKAIMLACQYLAAENRGEKNLQPQENVFLDYIRLSNFPDELRSNVTNLFYSQQLSGDVNPLFSGILGWITQNSSSITDAMAVPDNPNRDNDCMAFIMLTATCMAHPDVLPDVKNAYDEAFNWHQGGGDSLGIGMSKFVIAYYWIHDGGDKDKIAKDLDNFDKMGPKPGDDTSCSRAFKSFESDKALLLSKTPFEWPTEWMALPTDFIENELNLYLQWLNK